jgi:hypothetical protein
MTLWIAFAIWMLEIVLIAALAANRRGAQAGVALAVALLPLAGLVSTRSVLGLCVLLVALLFGLFRAWDFASGPPLPGFARRLLHLFAVVDTRRTTAARARFDGRALLRLLLGSALAAGALWVIDAADGYAGWQRLALRWYVGGLALVLALFDAFDALIALLAAAFGRAVPPVNRAPFGSTSLADFWGTRWNRIIGTILREHLHRPFARRSAVAGMLAAFVFSAAFHAYLMGIVQGPWHALAWAAFFLLQPPLIAIERQLRVRRWRPAFGRAWTLAVLGLLLPLFIEPALVVIERI